MMYEAGMCDTKTGGRHVRLCIFSRTKSPNRTCYRCLSACTFAPTTRAVQLDGRRVRASARKSLAGQKHGFCGGVSRIRATQIPDPLLPSGRPAYALSFIKAIASPCYRSGQRVGLRPSYRPVLTSAIPVARSKLQPIGRRLPAWPLGQFRARHPAAELTGYPNGRYPDRTETPVRCTGVTA